MMKKLLMSFAACTLILTSCSQNEVIENVDSGNGQLTFSPALGKQITKAAELMNTSLQTGAAKTTGTPIKLYAYQNTGSWGSWYTDGLSYNTTDSKWEITSTRFRNTSESKYITLFTKQTIAAADSAFWGKAFTTGNYPWFKYTIAANSVAQEDLLAGITEVGANQTDITIGMRHILSQVNFGVKGYKGANIKIRNIKVNGVFNSATYTFKAANAYPIGDWGTFLPATALLSYDYYNWGGSVTNNPQPLVPATATTGDKYIFGDGGNFGPGKVSDTYYPTGTSGAWEKGDAITANSKLNNSLMLLPQDFKAATNGANKDANVTFEYQITDVDGAYVAGTASTWASGQFKLDFTADNTAYASEWKQNYRYVYIIDFEKFLDDNKLDFTVSVELYPWVNYNADGDNDGIVDIPVAGEPKNSVINTVANSGTYYLASRSTTTTPATDVQLVDNQTWDWTLYDFSTIKTKKDNKITISFQKVVFNSKKITLTLPVGYTPAANTTGTPIKVTAHATLPNTWEISEGDKSADATITITRTDDPVVSPSAAVINKLANGATYAFGTTDLPQKLGANATWDWSAYAFTAIAGNSGDKITLNFQNVDFDSKAITLKLPTGYEVSVGGAAPVEANATPVTIDATALAIDNTVVITNTKTNYFRVASELKTAVQAQATTATYTFTGDGSAIDLDGYTMTAVVTGQVITIEFTGTAPTSTPVNTGWTWNSTTNTATYTGQ